MFVIFLLCHILFNVVTVKHPDIRGFASVDVPLPITEEITDILLPFTTHRTASRRLDTDHCFDDDYGTDLQECRLIKQFTQDYLDTHLRLRYKESRRFVFRPQLRGMGDMFGTLVFAYWTAVVSKRVFLVDWREPFPLEDLLQTARNTTDLFFRDAVDGEPHFVNGSHLLTGTNQSHARFVNVLSSNITTVFYTPQYRPPRDVLISLLKRNGADDESLLALLRLPSSPDFQRVLLHQVFQISDQIRQDQIHHAQDFRLSLGYKPCKATTGALKYQQSARPYIAVHARIGRGVGELNGRFKDVQNDLTVPARCLGIRAVRLSTVTGHPPLPIFLATDTTEFRTLFSEIVKDISRGQVTVLSGDWDIVHSGRFNPLDSSLNQSDYNNTTSWKKVWGSYMDLVMLGHAEHIVSLYSEFPRFAFALGDAKSLTELRNHVCIDTD